MGIVAVVEEDDWGEWGKEGGPEHSIAYPSGGSLSIIPTIQRKKAFKNSAPAVPTLLTPVPAPNQKPTFKKSFHPTLSLCEDLR